MATSWDVQAFDNLKKTAFSVSAFSAENNCQLSVWMSQREFLLVHVFEQSPFLLSFSLNSHMRVVVLGVS